MAKQGLQMLVGPAAEPVSVTEAKLHCSVDLSLHDGLIGGLIVAARNLIEGITGRQIVTATWLLALDGFYVQNLLPRPGIMLSSLAGGLAGWADAWRVWQERGGGWGVNEISTLRLPFSPIVQVSSIVYTDSSGANQTLAGDQYQVDTYQEPTRIVPTIGNTWPTTQSILNAVRITFQAGWPHTTIAGNISAGTRTVTPASMAGIIVGTVLRIDVDTSAMEWVTVTAVTGTTFTAVFSVAHTGPLTISGIPEPARQAIKLLVGEWYIYREAVMPSTMAELPRGVAALCDSLWWGDV